MPKRTINSQSYNRYVQQKQMTFVTIVSESHNINISRRNYQSQHYSIYNYLINASYTLKTKQLLNALKIKQIKKTIHSTSNSINRDIFNIQSTLTSSTTDLVTMNKQTKERHTCRKEVEEEIYKEFIRQKVLKYQHQFPRMTEFEIYQKIGREWQGFNQKQKQQLYNLYVSNHFIEGQALVKQQFGNVKLSYEQLGKQNNQQLVSLQKDTKIEEKSPQKRMTRQIAKQSNLHQSSKQQIIYQKPAEIKNQTMRYVQLGQNLSKKLKEFNQNSKQAVNLYKTVLEEVKKEHNKLVSSLNKQHVSPMLAPQVQQTAKKFNDTKKPLQRIDEQLAEQESSELSPEPNVGLKKQTIKNKIKTVFHKQNKGLRMAIKLKIDQCLRNNRANIKINQTKNPNLTVKLKQKSAIPKKTNDYLQFYKQGYKKLKQQCSFLNGLEITKILTHLWQKRKVVRDMALKKSRFSPASLNKNLPEKKIELSFILARKIGKINFIKSKLKEQYLPQEAHKMWASLPVQSKIKWIYPEKEKYLQFIQKPELPLHGKVRYRGNHTSDSHLYDLDWDIFDKAPEELHPKSEQEQSKICKQE